MPDITKATFNLPRHELDALRQLADRRSISVTQALRQALVTELYIQSLADHGSKLLVQDPEGSIQELVFNQTRMPAPQETRVPTPA